MKGENLDPKKEKTKQKKKKQAQNLNLPQEVECGFLLERTALLMGLIKPSTKLRRRKEEDLVMTLRELKE